MNNTGFLYARVRREFTAHLIASLFCTLVYAAQAADDRVKIDNDQARVLVVSSPPDVKSELHDHKINRVMIYA